MVGVLTGHATQLVRGGVAHVITDGLAGIENQMVPLLGLHHKILGNTKL